MAKELSQEQEMLRISLQLMRDHPRYLCIAPVILYGDVYVVPGDTLPTACTDGKNEKYGEDFLKQQNAKQKKFLRLHEVYHKAYRHLFIWAHLWKKSRNLANAACDIVINNELVLDTDLEMPVMDGKPCGLFDHRFDNMDAGEIFRIFEKEQQKRPKQPQGSGGQPPKTGDKGEPQQGNTPGSVKGEDIPRDDEGDMEGMDIHEWLEAQDLSEDEKKEVEREIDQALRQGLIMAGKAGHGGNRQLTEFLKPKVDWKQALRDYVKSLCANRDYTIWSKPSKRFMGGGYPDFMPGWVGDSVGRIGFYYDESGSVSHQLQMQFISEGKSICEEVNPEIFDVVAWDTQCGKHQMFLQDNQVEEYQANVQPSGGGGTNPSCIPPYMIENKITPILAVCLTDGYVPNWGDQINPWPCPVLWVVCGDKNANPNTGKVIFMEEE